MKSVKKTLPEKVKKLQSKATTSKAMATVKKVGKKGGVQMMGAAAGATVGAAVGGLAGAILADKKTRDVVGHKLGNLAKTAEKLNAKATEMTETARDTADQLAENSKKLQKKTQKMN